MERGSVAGGWRRVVPLLASLLAVASVLALAGTALLAEATPAAAAPSLPSPAAPSPAAPSLAAASPVLVSALTRTEVVWAGDVAVDHNSYEGPPRPAGVLVTGVALVAAVALWIGGIRLLVRRRSLRASTTAARQLAEEAEQWLRDR